MKQKKAIDVLQKSGTPLLIHQPKYSMLERWIEDGLLDVLDQTAAAKVTAWWGTDYVLLAKQNGKWMITHVLWQSYPKKP